MKYEYWFTLCCFIFFMQSCTSDRVKDIGEGYFYRDEGGDIKDILSENLNGGEIPATVLNFAYDSKFIIAKQKPKLPQDILYKRDYKYKTHNDEFYWIIIKVNNIVLGPLDKQEYITMRLKYRIPNDLILE